MTQGLAVDTIRIASIYASLVHAKDCSAHQSEDSPDDLVFQISKCTAIPSADEWVERMSDTSSSALEIAVHIWGLNFAQAPSHHAFTTPCPAAVAD